MMNMSFFYLGDDLMKDQIIFSILFFTIVFVIAFFIYYFLYEDRLKKEKYEKLTELGFLIKLNNLDKKKMDNKKCLTGVAFINAFIIAFTVTFLDAINLKMYLCLPIAFIMMIILIYSLYKMYGKKLAKKWGKK